MTVNLAPLFIVPAAAAVQSLAILITLFRLYFRLRIKRFWWEDMWAAIMVVCGIAFIIGQLVSLETDHYETAFITGWIASLAFTSTIWASRMSLLYSTVRVISPLSVLQKFTRILAVLFILFWATIIALKTHWCVDNTIPTHSLGKVRPMCALPNVEVLFEATTDCVSDIILVNLSLKLLWKVKLPQRLRRMILCLFSSSAIMSVFSLIHMAYCLLPLGIGRYVAFEAELTTALIICNLLVVVTYMFRVIRSSPNGSLPDEPLEDDDFTTPARTNVPRQLTTVDLDVTLGTHTGSSSNLASIASPSLRCSA